MAEKTLYIISEEEDQAADYQIGDLEEFGGRDFRTVKPLSRNGQREVASLLTKFSDCGAYTGTAVYYEEEEPNDTMFFVLTKRVKKQFFREQFHQLKNAINRLSLAEFASCDTGKIAELLNRRNGDLVYSYESGLETLDDFVRRAELGKMYYMAIAFGIETFEVENDD